MRGLGTLLVALMPDGKIQGLGYTPSMGSQIAQTRILTVNPLPVCGIYTTQHLGTFIRVEITQNHKIKIMNSKFKGEL